MENIKDEVSTHKDVRNIVLEMQKDFGGAIKPFGLFAFSFKLLQETSPSKMNRVKARNIAEVFSALQNEHFIINFGKKKSEWFYMTEKRWKKYGLGKKAIYNSRKFLEHYGIIESRVEQHPKIPQNKVRYYKFNVEMVEEVRRIAQSLL